MAQSSRLCNLKNFFLIAEKARARLEEVKRCRCYARQKAKAEDVQGEFILQQQVFANTLWAFATMGRDKAGESHDGTKPGAAGGGHHEDVE